MQALLLILCKGFVWYKLFGLVIVQEEIRRELDLLCDDLPKSVVGECEEFVNTYEEQLVEMFLADFTPKQICTYLKLCDPTMKERVTTPVPVPEICKSQPPCSIYKSLCYNVLGKKILVSAIGDFKL